MVKSSLGAAAGITLGRLRKRNITMLGTRRWIASGLLLASSFLLAQAVFAQTAAPAPHAKRHRKSHKRQAQLVLPPLPAGPLRQLPMDQMPSSPAKVNYEGGLLTIAAQNSTLGEILRDVRSLTGASIDIPQNANERVVAYLGPGAPRDVLAGLLNGCSFNYVMVGSIADPLSVSSVILTPRPSSPGATPTAAEVYQTTQPTPERFAPHPFSTQVIPPPGTAQPAADAEADDSKDEDSENADDNAEDQAQPAQPPVPPDPNSSAAQDQQQADPNQPNAGPKTPEQILEMLRRQQQPGGAVIPPPQPPQQ